MQTTTQTRALVEADPQQAVDWCRAATGVDFVIESNQPGRIELTHERIGNFSALNVVHRINTYISLKPKQRNIGESNTFYLWQLTPTRIIKLCTGFGLSTASISLTLVDNGEPNAI